jgi:hypothetical protein
VIVGTDRTRVPRAGRVARGWAAVAGAVLLLVAMAMPARASSIVYLDQHDDIWMTSPDGSVKRQITTNGSSEGYSSPSMTDSGVIVAGAKSAFFFYFNRDGSSFGGPWTAFDMNCAFEQQPLSNQVAPNGGSNVYWYIDDGSGCNDPSGPTVAFAAFNSLTAEGLFATYDGVWYPRWIPGTAYPAAVEIGGASINTLNTAGGTPWITDSADGLRYFDISRTGGKVLIADAHDPSNVTSPSDLVLWQNVGTPPATDPGSMQICQLANWGDNMPAPDISVPRWSPDGSAFTWSDSRGVWVSPAPVADAGGNCVIHPTLIAAGGHSPDWGVPDVLTTTPPPGPIPPNPSGPVGPTNAQITALLRKFISPKGKSSKIGQILAKGYSFSFTAPSAGRLVVGWYQVPKGAHLTAAKPVVVASAKTSFSSAIKKKVTVKLTTYGRKLLRRSRSIKLTDVATFTPSGKPGVTVIRGFTLKR